MVQMDAQVNGSNPDPPVNAYREIQVGQVLPVTTLSELRKRYSGEISWIVEGYLARRELAFLAGAGDSLKSWTAAHLAAAIDGRFKWLGEFDVSADRVLYIEQERAANLVYQLNRIEVAERVELGSDRLVIVPPCPLPLSETDAQTALLTTVLTYRPDVVVINALRDVLGRANENSPTDIAPLLRTLARIAEQNDCCIIPIDHFNKAGLSGLVRGNAAHAGTAQKHSEADVVLAVERPRDEMGKGVGAATVSVTKKRSGEAGAPFAVSVTDTADGGVLVRAEAGVKGVSPTARAVQQILAEGEMQVADLRERLGKPADAIRQALSELRAAGLVDGTGERGKAFTYRLRNTPAAAGQGPKCKRCPATISAGNASGLCGRCAVG
jgi:hypothetical protein